MDQEIRVEFEKLHGRVSNLRERVVNLEAQQPHINASLARIENSVDRLNGHLTRAIWIVISLAIAVVVKFALSGGFAAGL